MEFRLDETQQAVADLARDTLERVATPARIAEHEREGGRYDAVAWKAMAQAGLLAIGLPRELGGDGLGSAEVALVLREVGRRTAPVPALATLGLAAPLVVAYGGPCLRAELLPGVASGELLLTAALREPGRPSPQEPATTARDAPDGHTRNGATPRPAVLDGVKGGVPYAADAHRILVTARTADDEVRVYLVDPRAPGVTIEQAPAAGRVPEYTVRLTAARAAAELGGAEVAADLHRHALAGTGAVLDGVLSGAVELTTEHVRTREQFGRPLATFQAVAERIANVSIDARTLHLVSLAAAWRLATGRDADTDLEVLGYWAAERGPRALQTCHHLHGGLGLDITYPLHRYYAWAKDLSRLLGGPSYRLARIGTPAAR